MEPKWPIPFLSGSAFVVFLALAATPAGAGDWVGGVGNWNNPNNWDVGGGAPGLPGAMDSASITNGGTATINALGPQCADLLLGHGAASAGTVEITSGGLTVGAAVAWGTITCGRGLGATGTFDQSGGQVDLHGELILNYYGSAFGYYYLSGGAQLHVWEDAYICYNSHDLNNPEEAFFTHTGGDCHINGDLYIAYTNSGSEGTYEMGPGAMTLSADDEYVGYEGYGKFIHSDGDNNPNNLYLAHQDGSQGEYTLNSGNLNVGNSFVVGHSGAGTFEQAGGMADVPNDLRLAWNGTATGTYRISGGDLIVHGSIVGGGGSSTLIIDGGNLDLRGTSILVDKLWIGKDPGSNGSYVLADLKDVQVEWEYIGDEGTGVLTQNGGSNQVDNDLAIGIQAGGDGTYHHNEGSATVMNDVIIGNAAGGTGRYNLNGGVLSVWNELRIGSGGAGGSGYFHWTDDGDIGGLATSIVSILQNGTMEVDHDWYYGGDLSVDNGELDIQAHILGIDVGGSATVGGPLAQVTASEIQINVNGPGDFFQHDGTVTVSGSLKIGFNNVCPGTYELNGGLLEAGDEYVGYQGNGTFDQWGGTNRISGGLYVSYDTNSVGQYNLNLGQLEATDEHVGCNEPGQFIQSGGSNKLSGSLYVSHQPGSAGSLYDLDGGELEAKTEYIGYGDDGGFEQEVGTTNTVSDNLYLGYSPGKVGTYTMNSGTLSAGDAVDDVEYVGYEGQGVFDQHGGLHQVSGDLVVSSEVDSGGTYNLDSAFGAATLSVGRDEYLGHRELGTFNQDAGTHAVGWSLFLGYHLGVEGRYFLDGGDVQAYDLYVGKQGLGTFTQTTAEGASTVTVNDLLSVGDLDGSEGEYHLMDGRVDALTLSVGTCGRGTFEQHAGTCAVSGSLYLGFASSGIGEYRMNGGDLLVSGAQAEVHGAYVGYEGSSEFNRFCQIGGTVEVHSLHGDPAYERTLYVGYEAAAQGTYELAGGSLTADNECIGWRGTGTFLHTGALSANTVLGDLVLGRETGATGRYRLDPGVIPMVHLNVSGNIRMGLDGTWGDSRFEWHSGTIHAPSWQLGPKATLAMGFSFDVDQLVGGGLFGGALSGLSQATLEITNGATATHDNGDQMDVGVLRIGSGDGAGTYTISSGDLQAGDLVVGVDGTGTLDISAAAPVITVSNRLCFGPDAVFTAPAGGTIHMAGSAFQNQSVSEAALADLEELTLIFEAGTEVVDPVEVAGQDLGPIAAGWINNFALETLQLGGTAAGRVRLVDESDNQEDGLGHEALYVHNLILNFGAKVDLNDKHLYYYNAGPDPKQFFPGDANLDGKVSVGDVSLLADNWGESGKTWGEGDFTGDGNITVGDVSILADNWGSQTGGGGCVPEPAALGLIAAGAALVLRKPRRAAQIS